MTSFTHTITHPLGLHARPAAQLTEVCRGLTSQITLSNGERSVPATGLVSLLLLGVSQGDTVTVTLEGREEVREAQVLEDYFRANL